MSCRQKETAAANRKDAKLKAVVISEAWDKKASKYNSSAVPFPFDSRATYERSMRTPMGREYNTTATHRYILLGYHSNRMLHDNAAIFLLGGPQCKTSAAAHVD